MENNQLAVVSQTRGLMPAPNEWNRMKEIASMALRSGMLPAAIKTPEAAAIIALKGRELGLPPMVAFSHIHVIQGRPTMSAEIMLAYVYKDHPGAVVEIVERSETRCEIHARRGNETKLTKFEWNLERAKKMGLLGKDNWVKQPGTMMFWRTISEMKRAKFPEVLMGIDYSTEELQDSGARDVVPVILPTEPPPQTQSIAKKPKVADKAKDVTPKENSVGPQGAEMDRESKGPKNFATAEGIDELKKQREAKEAAATAKEPSFDPEEVVRQEKAAAEPPATAPAAPSDAPSFKEVYSQCVEVCRAIGWSPVRLGDFCREKFKGMSLKDLQNANDVSRLVQLYETLLQCERD